MNTVEIESINMNQVEKIMKRREERRELCSLKAITLDGKPAKISGAANQFASIWAFENPSFEVQFAWETVAKIVKDNHGQFKSN